MLERHCGCLHGVVFSLSLGAEDPHSLEGLKCEATAYIMGVSTRKKSACHGHSDSTNAPWMNGPVAKPLSLTLEALHAVNTGSASHTEHCLGLAG